MINASDISCVVSRNAPTQWDRQDMDIPTKRFGVLNVRSEDVIHFPNGLIGLEDCHRWVLLTDQRNSLVAWLQSIEQPDFALAVVSPRRFVPALRVRVSRWELEPICLKESRQAEVLAVLGKNAGGIVLNLKAPLVLNLECRLGCQVIANDDLPVQYALGEAESGGIREFRRTA